jgi:hypothetical protein
MSYFILFFNGRRDKYIYILQGFNEKSSGTNIKIVNQYFNVIILCEVEYFKDIFLLYLAILVIA